MRADTVDRDLERLLCTRSAEDTTPDPTVLEPSYLESVRRFNARVRAENREAWCEYHRDQAERLRASLVRLVEFHEEQAAKLQEGTS